MFMTGIHADLRDKYQMPVTLGEFRSEILISDVTSMGEGVYGPPMTNNLLTKDNTGVDDWYEVYPNIMHINLFIRNVDKEIDYMTGMENHFIWDRLMACVHITISIFIEHLVVCR